MDAVERILLNTVQTAFPVTSHPYQTLGKLAGVSEDEAWQRVSQLRQEGIIRRLGGVFDSHRLGYHSTLCAAKVPKEKVSVLAEVLMKIPGVTHNYLRDHPYNMWFTLIASSEAEAEKNLNKVRQVLDSEEVYSLPAIRLFKISVDFDFMENAENDSDNGSSSIRPPGAWEKDSRPEPTQLSDQDKALIRVLQGNLPFSRTPFSDLAQELGWAEEEVLARTVDLLTKGLIRRFGAVLRHQRAGFTANAMGVWQVPEEKAQEIGEKMATFREVSHCYQRPSLPDWPYNLFTMIHGRSAEECQEVMQRISKATGLDEYRMLFSQAELKKSSMQYFLEEND